MSYDRRAASIPSLNDAQGKWLESLGNAIVERARALNRHMTGSVIPKSTFRIDVVFEGEDPSDMPASSFGLLYLMHGTVDFNCEYNSVSRGNSDAKFTLNADDAPGKFIDAAAKFLVGWMP
jgi:hypothetical protein